MKMTEMRWTGEQVRAILAQGHTLLEANAGTGKTTTVIGKILWQLGLRVGFDEDFNEIPANPMPCGLDEIAAITFTEKAAYDLKRKLREALADSPRWEELRWQTERASIGTIHSFCADLLREHALRLGCDPSFGVLDEMEAQLELDEIIKDIVIASVRSGDEATAALVAERGLQKRSYRDGAVDLTRAVMRDLRWHPERYVRQAASAELDMGSLRERVDDWDALDDASGATLAALHRLARAALFRWERHLEEENALDFDGLILDAREGLLSDDSAAALASLRRRYRLLVIDELQDTDGAQRDVAFAIAGIGAGGGALTRTAPQLFLVGDPKQSIYRFRGADVSIWGDVSRAICGGEEPLKLTHNFRSDPAIVDFVNRVSAPAIAETGTALDEVQVRARVDYAELVPHRQGSPAAGVEWLEVPYKSSTRRTKRGAPANMLAGERREEEAGRVAARIRQLVEEKREESGSCGYGDIAILFRTRAGLECYEAALRAHGVPYYLAGDAGLTERLEILDLVNVLRVLENPADDLRAFAYLRSPFVGLRDEVLARIRLDPALKGGTFLQRARDYAERGEWFDPPEGGEIARIEREALRRGVRLVEGLSRLRSRWPLDRLLEEILRLGGYRAHLELTEQPEPKLANVQRFVRLLEGYRSHTLSSFLELWSRWEAQDLGIPQAPLYSKGDDVVTLSTIHSAKGLEWSVVFLVDVQDRDEAHRLWGSFWSDRELGPLLCPRKSDAGARARRLVEREAAERAAESARLLYVASTRASRRLVIAGPLQGKLHGHARWLAQGQEAARVGVSAPVVAPPEPAAEPTLEWLGTVRKTTERPALAQVVAVRPHRFARSATELMTRRRSRHEWALKYRFGVIPRWYFARRPAGAIPAWLRGTLIHGVLERIEDAADVAELLDVAIGALDAPELEERLARDGDYRTQLEREIEAVVSSSDWAWYTEGRHQRELAFVRLAGEQRWYTGAFDLYRPRPDENWVVDFKTHRIEAEAAERTARDYRLQALLYSRVAGDLTGRTRVRLHFTRPNVAVDMHT